MRGSFDSWTHVSNCHFLSSFDYIRLTICSKVHYFSKWYPLCFLSLLLFMNLSILWLLLWHLQCQFRKTLKFQVIFQEFVQFLRVPLENISNVFSFPAIFKEHKYQQIASKFDLGCFWCICLKFWKCQWNHFQFFPSFRIDF